jgi:hypothetical protein
MYICTFYLLSILSTDVSFYYFYYKDNKNVYSDIYNKKIGIYIFRFIIKTMKCFRCGKNTKLKNYCAKCFKIELERIGEE